MLYIKHHTPCLETGRDIWCKAPVIYIHFFVHCHMKLCGTASTMSVASWYTILVLLSARVGVCGGTNACNSGQHDVGGVCTACPARHFCRGDDAPAAPCPANSFDFRAGESRSLDDCACDAGYFRTDNAEVLALALAQNGVTLQDSRRLWCIKCPVGYHCHTLRGSAGPQTQVQRCPALATTQSVGSLSPTDCVCTPGSYANSSSSCAACTKNHYCTGGSVPPIVCPLKTVSGTRATSVAGCTCLPPLVMLPTDGRLLSYDCVVQSAAASTDAGITQGLQAQQYDIFGLEAGMLFDTFAVPLAGGCTMIHTGVVFCARRKCYIVSCVA